jgi:hypothetical protein
LLRAGTQRCWTSLTFNLIIENFPSGYRKFILHDSAKTAYKLNISTGAKEIGRGGRLETRDLPQYNDPLCTINRRTYGVYLERKQRN